MQLVEANHTKIGRLIRAQTDPDFAAQIKIQTLAPEMSVQQKGLRKALAGVEKNLASAESSLAVIKAKYAIKGSVKAPTMESINIAVSKILNAARVRAAEVDDLQKAFVDVSINSPGSAKRYTTPRKGNTGSGSTANARKLEMLSYIRATLEKRGVLENSL